MNNSYDPRYPEIWRDAALKLVSIPCPNRKAAITLRHRLYRARTAMEREAHPYAEMAKKASASIVGTSEDGSKIRYTNEQGIARFSAQMLNQMKWTIELSPGDDAFDDSLAAAGYGVPEAGSLD